MSPKSLARLFREMDMDGCKFVDFGAADGRAMLAAWLAGADSVLGYELPGNLAQKLVFDAVLSKLPSRAISSSSWLPNDIDKVFSRFVPECAG